MITPRPSYLHALLLLSFTLGIMGTSVLFVTPWVTEVEARSSSTNQALVVACVPATQGFVVDYSQASPTTTYQAPLEGERCLPALARFPLEARRKAPHLPETHGGGEPPSSVHPGTLLFWTFEGKRLPLAALGCQVDGQGILKIVFFDRVGGGGPTMPQIDGLCLQGVATMEALGYQASGPVPTVLGQDEEDHTKGGLLWVKQTETSVEVIACNLDDQQQLVTTYQESSGAGQLPTGQSCLTVIADQGRENSLKVDGPVPVPAGDDDGDDGDDCNCPPPDCLIWDIDSAA